VAVLIVTFTHLAGDNSRSCDRDAPIPSLNAQLRALGGFDQPYDASDAQVLESLAAQAASATATGLIGAAPADPVAVSSVAADQPDAIVVPLQAAAPDAGAPRVSGLVSFLRDCAGRAYYSAVDDLTAHGAVSSRFPAVSEAVAAGRLGVATPQLVYTSDPFRPSWRDPRSGLTTPAE